jgi:hypothetical protein
VQVVAARRQRALAVGRYDPTQPLTIDPGSSFSRASENGTPVAAALDGAATCLPRVTRLRWAFREPGVTFPPTPNDD